MLGALCYMGCGASEGTSDHEAGGLRFTDVSASSGIDLENVSGKKVKTAIPESVGQGAATLDYDGDGLLDFFIVNGDTLEGTDRPSAGRSALYRNLGEFRFADVTTEAGLEFKAWGHGATVVDFDADGWPDLYVTVYGGPNRFYRNNADGTFEEASGRWGGADPGPSTAATFFDPDGDGDLDLYVGNFVDYDPLDPPNGGRLGDWRGLKIPVGPLGTPTAPDRFYENRGEVLVEASAQFGFDSVEPSYALAVVTCDYDGDGDVDLFVANDSKENYLFENGGDGHFRDVGLQRGVALNQNGVAQSCMGVDFGDVDNDGHLDLFVTNFSHDTNTLYCGIAVKGGKTVFEDATAKAGLGLPSFHYLSWGTRFVDLDLDGWLDIVVASGHVYPGVDAVSESLGTSFAQTNQLFRNLGSTQQGSVRFELVQPSEGDAFQKSAVSRGLVTADLDDDGDQDFLVVEMGAEPTLIRNDSDSQGHWIGFRLNGEGSNRDAIGARLSVVDSAGIVRVMERTSGASFLSTCDSRVVFGLGAAGTTIRKLEVRWPSGNRTVHEGLEVDCYWVIDAVTASARPAKL